MKKNILFWIKIAWLAIFFQAIFPQSYADSFEKKFLLQRPDTAAIEENLFKFVNQEREKQNLPLLTLSSNLSLLARAHSQDMAQHKKLSHLSSSERPYTARLADKGFYFIERGENIAFSETFKTEFIHKSLMESQAHRENILDPKFDQVGIGVVLKEESGYYVTQDFIQSLKLKDDKEAQDYLKNKLNSSRASLSLPFLSFSQDLDSYALRYSRAKAQNSSPPPPPSGFGRNLIIFIATPFLETPFASYKDEIQSKNYEKAGLGIKFSRSQKYPGGAYFITLILLIENRYKYLNTEELRKLVLEAINKIRQKAALDPFQEDLNFSTNTAQPMAEQSARRRASSLDLPRFRTEAVFCYLTEKPDLLPSGLIEKIGSSLRGHKKIGIGIHFRKTRDFPRGIFWVAVIFKQ